MDKQLARRIGERRYGIARLVVRMLALAVWSLPGAPNVLDCYSSLGARSRQTAPTATYGMECPRFY